MAIRKCGLEDEVCGHHLNPTIIRKANLMEGELGMTYEALPNGIDFSTEFPTYILAFCPDTDSWFATNQRFFYYEYPMDFPNEKAAIDYFKMNPDVFLKIEENMEVYRPSFYSGGVWLENTKELVKTGD